MYSLTSDNETRQLSNGDGGHGSSIYDHVEELDIVSRRITHQDYKLYLQNIVRKFIEERESDRGVQESSAEVDPFVTLPPEVIFRVLSFLGLNELCTSRRVSKTYQRMINSYLHYIQKLDCAPYEPVLSPSGLSSIISQVRNLRELNLDFCWISVTEDNLFAVAINCPNLQTLNTSRCKGVSDAFLQHLSVTCRDLENLNLSSCFQISDKGLVAVAEHCKKLQDLCVSSTYGVTDITVEALAKHCTTLEELDISWCYKVTDKSLKNFIIFGKQLKLLRVKGTQISTGMIARLAERGITVNDSF